MAFGAELADFVNGFGAGQKLMGGTREEREDRRLDREFKKTKQSALEEDIATSRYKRNEGVRASEDFGKYVGGQDFTSGTPAATEVPPEPERDMTVDGPKGDEQIQGALPTRKTYPASQLQADASVPQSIKWLAQEVGTTPQVMATAMSYETGGTFDPSIRGGAGNRHIGVIQFGPEEAKKYGANPNQTFAEQMPAVAAYLKDRGFKPGMGLLDLYSTINAGSPGRYNASDASNGGAPGSVRDKVEQQMAGHAQRARQMFAAVDDGSGGGGAIPTGRGSAAPTEDTGSALAYSGAGRTAIPGRTPKAERNSKDDPDANVFVKAFHHVKEAMNYGIDRDGADKSGAIDDGQPHEGATKYQSGYGAAPPSLVQQAEAKIDPEGKMPESERKLRALNTVSEYYRDKGDVKAANEATYSMIQYYRQVSQRYGAFAQVAAQNGDMDAAASAAVKAYANIPDGKDLKIVKDGDNYGFQFTDLETGKVMQQGIMTPQQMGALAMKVSPADFDKFIMASGGSASGRGRSTGGGTAGGSDAFNNAKASLYEGDALPARASRDGMSAKEYADYNKEFATRKAALDKAAKDAAPKPGKPEKVPTSAQIEGDATSIDDVYMDLPTEAKIDPSTGKEYDQETMSGFIETATDLYTMPQNRKNRLTAKSAAMVPLDMAKVDPAAPGTPPFDPKPKLIEGDDDNVAVTIRGRAKPVIMSKDTFVGFANRWKSASDAATAKSTEAKIKAAKTGKAEAGYVDQMKESGSGILAGVMDVPSRVMQGIEMSRAETAASDTNRANQVGEDRSTRGAIDDGGALSEVRRKQQLMVGQADAYMRNGRMNPLEIAQKLTQNNVPQSQWPPALVDAIRPVGARPPSNDRPSNAPQTPMAINAEMRPSNAPQSQMDTPMDDPRTDRSKAFVDQGQQGLLRQAEQLLNTRQLAPAAIAAQLQKANIPANLWPAALLQALSGGGVGAR